MQVFPTADALEISERDFGEVVLTQRSRLREEGDTIIIPCEYVEAVIEALRAAKLRAEAF